MLLFRRSRTLMAQSFDTNRLQLRGDVFPIAECVGLPANSHTGFGAFSGSVDGTLMLGSGGLIGLAQLVWMDRAGRRLGAVTEPVGWDGIPPRIAPNSSMVAYGVEDGTTNAIWLQGLTKMGATGNLSRFSFAPGVNLAPIWSPDGTRIVYSSTRNSVLTPELLMKSANG